MNNKVLIFGDAMLDTYIEGKVERVSPEAPVPVVKPNKFLNCLGGAANVARNASSLNSDVTVLFTLGNDDNGKYLIEELIKFNVKCDSVICRDEITTINKVRIIGNNQQIVRIDYNDRYNLRDGLEDEIIKSLDNLIPENDIIIISDYNKGTCTDRICKFIIEKSKDKIVIVDPKGVNWEKYRGSTIITPNMKEINEFSGKKVENSSAEIENEYSDFSQSIGVRYTLLTRSEEGMSLLGGEKPVHLKACTQEVYDVSGAGDTVVGALASYLNIEKNNNNIVEAAEIANIAAGVVVKKPGTAVVSNYEIDKEKKKSRYKEKKSKIFKDLGSLLETINEWKEQGNTIVTTNGCFDIIHVGHIKLLNEASKLGDKLIVGINSDESVKRLKGENRPINNQEDRARIVSEMEMVDAVVIFDPKILKCELTKIELNKLSERARQSYNEAPIGLIKAISPDIHVKGGDYKIDDIPEGIYAKKVSIVEITEGYSTTNIINKL